MMQFSRAAILTLLVGATGAFASGPSLEGYRIDAYIDEAPPNAHVMERVQVRVRDVPRTLLVVSYEQNPLSTQCNSCEHLFDVRGSLQASGSEEAIERMIASPRGTRVSGTLLRPRSRVLVIQELGPPAENRTLVGEEAKGGSAS